MSELSCKFQITASNTVGGVAETKTVLQSVTDVRHMYVCTDKSKTICPSTLRGEGGVGNEKKGWHLSCKKIMNYMHLFCSFKS